MKPGLSFLLVFCLLFVPFSAALAGEATFFIYPQAADASNYPEITLALSAWDAAGLPLAGLTPDQFSIQEDGGQPIQPLQVVADANAPLRVALVIDVSESMTGQPLNDARTAALLFLNKIKGNQAALIAFSSPLDPDPTRLDPKREIGFSQDLTPLYDLVDGLKASGQTRLYDAAAKAVGLFAETPPGHRAILLLTDGRNDPAEAGDPQQAIQLAQQARVPFYVIGLGNGIDLNYLQRLASATGGLFRAAPRSAELAQTFDDMAILLKTQYRVTYRSNLPADGQAHTIKLALRLGSAQTQAELPLGPLPAVQSQPPAVSAPTAIQLPATFQPPVEATQLVVVPVPVAATLAPPPPPPASFCEQFLPGEVCRQIGWPLAAVLALLLAGLVAWLLRRKPAKPKPEACAKCGFDLTGRSGACPQCGETRRLPKMAK